MSEQIDLTDYADSDSEEDSEWTEKRLGEIFDSIYSGGTPKKGVDEYYDGRIPFVKIEDLNEQQGDGVTTAKNYITEKALEETSTRAFDSETLLMTIYGSLAETAIVQSRVATNQGILGLWDADDDNVLYVRYAIDNTQPKLASLSRQTTQANLGKGIVKKHKIPIPPLPEQRKIATVLYTIDRAIEKTKEVINQVRRVRDGVRQDIFSHGIRQSGIERAEDELKETYLGNIPNNWQLRRVDEVCSHVVDCPHSTPDYSGEGTVVVRTSEIEEGRYYPAESPRVDEEGYQKRISRLEPKPGDVVFTREAPIGESFKIPDGMRLCLGQRLVQLRPKDDILNGDYLVELLYSDMLQNWFERSARGSTSKHINVEDIEGMEIPVPSIEEQRRIVEVLGGFRGQIDSERNLLNSYERLKHGLQQDLLTGTVRTTDTNIEVPDEITQHG